MMNRVVITGLGIISSIGQNQETVLASLKQGKSGIKAHPEFKELGFRSQVAGLIDITFKDHIDRKQLRFMGDGAAYAHIAMEQAIADAGLSEEEISHPRTGLIVGTGGISFEHQLAAADTLRKKGIKRVSSYTVPRIMANSASASLATYFKIKGLSYSLSSACATSSHCIGHAFEQIQSGKQDRIFAGGGEELHWALAVGFDAMGALSTQYNDTPEQASRAYDENRDGFVISAGGGILVLESLEAAQARGAKIYAEIVGYGATSDGADMVAPSGEGAERCMQMALNEANASIDYINTHGTSTPKGDLCEIGAMTKVFGQQMPMISSTKSMTGHALGAAGVHEAIYTLLMMEHGFIAPSINIDSLDPDAQGAPILTETCYTQINTAMSNSFGFGGTNASLIFKKFD